jgi:predicted RNA-binding protein with PUA-like domain
MKTEPEDFSIDDLARVVVEPWSGVRNVFARANMRRMVVGDGVLFYHSSCIPPGVAGLAKVARVAVVDETQFDPASKYYDATATREKPKWDCVDVEFVEKLPRLVSLDELRDAPGLGDMKVHQKGWGRLSVQAVTDDEYRIVCELARGPAPPPKPPKPKPKRKRKKKARKAKRKARSKKSTAKSPKRRPRTKRKPVAKRAR